ncbi:MAG: Mut7-C RNAse domain-containing protein [Dehalococcoidia bacterium]|nr:Mut7-C RNAse domain-containing protein [Dehalococcoidia bacterium]
MDIAFIVDSNAGKLARWLRMMGYDTLFFNDIEDGRLVDMAMKEGRVVVTRDTQIAKRRVAANGSLRVIVSREDDPKQQLMQVMRELNLDCRETQFTRCLECNQRLIPREKDEVRDLVPPYVFRTQKQYMQCPSCSRVYWQGTHWQRMKKALDDIAAASSERNQGEKASPAI